MELKVPDAFVGNPTAHGGIGRLLRFVGACEHAGIDFWCYSGDSGIGSAAYLHLCAALGWIREPNQSLFRMQPMDITEEGPFSPEEQCSARAGRPRPRRYTVAEKPRRLPPATSRERRHATNTTTRRSPEPTAVCR